MTTVAMKRGAKPPKRKPVAQRKPQRAMMNLPVDALTLRRNLVISVALLSMAAAVALAMLAGLPQRWWAETVRQSAMAGFEIRHVEVSGTKEMQRLPVYDAALSGSSNAMLTADLPAIRARLLALPWVADASVGRQLPDTLSIQIVERRPVALWQHQGRFAAIDISGQVLTRDRLERFASLPVVVGPGANNRVREMLTIAAAAPTLVDRVDAGILVGGRRWDVRFKSGETLALPDTPAAARAAIKRFAGLEASLDDDSKLLGGRFERFDMRVPGRMTVGGAAVKAALEAAAKAQKAQKANTI